MLKKHKHNGRTYKTPSEQVVLIGGRLLLDLETSLTDEEYPICYGNTCTNHSSEQDIYTSHVL